uniref:2'-5' oligoadenylate synthase n=1 Tax=Ailuropoda melanoleuca TaxID=9646 RepID=A0A7N5K2I0_AILME
MAQEPALLYQTPAGDLDKFISEFLQPNRQFLVQVNKAVDIICSFLKENCFRNSAIKVLKVVKGGSLAKGTALRGCSDADLVVFLSCFSQFAEQGNRRAEIISEIRAQLEACQQKMRFEVKFEIPKWENSRVLSFSLTSQTMLDQSVDFDVLPAFNALGEVPSFESVRYVDLIHSYNHAGEYSTCFTELHVDQHIPFPLIPQCNKMPKGKGFLPPQHGLELLTVYAWEQGGRDTQFDMAQGFRSVLELVSQYPQLCVYWAVNYNYEDETPDSNGDCRPVILDPADPTGNLGRNARWDLLAREAAACMSALCCLSHALFAFLNFTGLLSSLLTCWNTANGILHPQSLDGSLLLSARQSKGTRSVQEALLTSRPTTVSLLVKAQRRKQNSPIIVSIKGCNLNPWMVWKSGRQGP